ncbi:MAG: hypothetical protein ACYC2K_10860 [Gemmatimonadales bacterium]
MKSDRVPYDVRCAVAILLLAAMVNPAVAQSRVVYQADAAFDLDAGSLDVIATLELPSTTATGDTIRLLLNRGLVIREISGDGVGPYRLTPFKLVPSWNEVAVGLDGPVIPGRVRTMRIVYGGRPELSPNGSNAILPTRVELGLGRNDTPRRESPCGAIQHAADRRSALRNDVTPGEGRKALHGLL